MTDSQLNNSQSTAMSEAMLQAMANAETPEDYEKLRNGDLTGAAPDNSGETTEAEPDKSGETTDPSPENDEEDAVGDGGQADEAEAGGRLPKGIQKRLEREKRKLEKAAKEAKEWRRKFEELQAQQGSQQGSQPAPAQQPEAQPAKNTAPDQPLPDEEYEKLYDYPDQSDYATENDDGETAWLDDLERWEKNLPLRGGKHAGKQAEQQPAPQQADTKPPEETPQQNPQQDQQAEFMQMWEDIRETLSEDGVPENLEDEFFDMLKSNKLILSDQMVEWLADHEDGAATIAAAFVESPRRANRIRRKPANRHAKMMTDLLRELRGQTSSGDRDQVTPVTRLSGQRGLDTSQKINNPNLDFATWSKVRASLDA